MNYSLSRYVLCLAVGLLPLTSWADVKIRPGDKPSESTKEFIKDRKKNGYPTPEPHDRTVNFTTGQSVDIDLDVATSYLGNVKIFIRDLPAHGKLSEIKPHPSGESNKAMVTYTHGGDPDQIADKFTFQAKIGDGNTSAPGTITLVGKRAVAKLEILEPARFKRLQPGETDSGRVVIMNTGTAPFSGDITWPKPFIGPPSLQLAVNEKQTFIIMLTAPAPGAYRIDQELQPGVATSKVQVYVECIQPFSVQPSLLMLAFDAVSGTRGGSVKISNASTAPLKLRLEVPNRLQVAREVVLEPKSSKDVLIALAPNDVVLFHGELWVIQEPHREKVVIHAEPEPAQIRLEKVEQGTIEFGRVEKGKKGESLLTVINDGGAPAILKLANSPPFTLTAKGTENPVIEPGKQLQLAVTFAPEQPGNFNGALLVSGNAGSIPINAHGLMFDPKRPATMSAGIENPHTPARPTSAEAVKPRESASKPRSMAKTPPPALPPSLSKPVASVPPPPVEAAPAPSVAPASAPAAQGSALKSMQQMTGKSAEFYGRLATFGLGIESLPEYKSKILEPVPAIGVSEAGRDYVVLTWGSPKVAPERYLIQTSLLVRNEATGMPMKSWRNVDGWKPVPVPNGASAARIEGLQPDTGYELRVLGVDHDGKLSPSSDLLRVFTQPAFTIPGWVWQLLIGAVLAVTVMVFRRVREQRAYA